MVDETPTPSAARRINVASVALVGQIDNERPSSRPYATATGDQEPVVSLWCAVPVDEARGEQAERKLGQRLPADL
jgi:hypothetical protein